MVLGFPSAVLFASSVVVSAQALGFGENNYAVPFNRTATHTPSSTSAAEKPAFLKSGIIAAIGILVIAVVLICMARCLLLSYSDQHNSDDGTGHGTKRSFEFRQVSNKQVCVVNPGGSVKIGRRDSAKDMETSADPEGQEAADCAERGISPVRPCAGRTNCPRAYRFEIVIPVEGR